MLVAFGLFVVGASAARPQARSTRSRRRMARPTLTPGRRCLVKLRHGAPAPDAQVPAASRQQVANGSCALHESTGLAEAVRSPQCSES